MALDFEAFKAYIESDGEIEFDLYAQDPHDWSWLQEIIPGIVISSAGGVVPFQAEGLIYGHPFYYRDRHGSASLSVGAKDGEKPYLGDTTLYSAGCETPEFEGGEHFIRNLVRLVPELKRSPFPYEFEGWKLNFANDGEWNYTIDSVEKTRHCGWGYTREEAYDYLSKTSTYLEEHGFTPEKQMQAILDQDFDRIPVKDDTRVYPEVDPPFTVILP